MLDIFSQLPGWLVAITSLVTACNAVTCLTPSNADDKIVSFLLKILNVASLNVGKNINKDS